MASDYETFKQKYLVKNFTDKWGKPKHTRLVKDKFYRYNAELKEEFGFDLSVCGECGCTSHNGRPLMMELEHINRITNDSRIENLRSLCPNCHTQTDGYKNRMSTIEEYWGMVWGKVWKGSGND
jgi:5-methylcytosine-specific restriction endonuclease McrA